METGFCLQSDPFVVSDTCYAFTRLQAPGGEIRAVCCGEIGKIEETFHNERSVSFEWKIPNMFSMSETLGDWYYSPSFNALDATWHMRICPNAVTCTPFIGFELRTFHPPKPLNFSLGIINADGEKEEVHREQSFPDRSSFWRLRRFIKRSELEDHKSQLAPSDTFTIICTMWSEELPLGDKKQVSRETQTEDVSPDTAVREELDEHLDAKSLASPGQNLKDLYLDEKNCDVAITVRNRTFNAHRAVLEARAPVLANDRSHRMAEKSSEVIYLMDCEPNAFAAFLRFLYSGTIENLSGEIAADVFYIAKKYAFPELKQKCVGYMLDSLTIGSICSVVDLAVRHGERDLLERATEFFIENAQEILPTVQWRRFMVENPVEANELYIQSLAFYAREK